MYQDEQEILIEMGVSVAVFGKSVKAMGRGKGGIEGLIRNLPEKTVVGGGGGCCVYGNIVMLIMKKALTQGREESAKATWTVRYMQKQTTGGSTG